MKHLIVLAALLISFGCASTHPGKKAEPIGALPPGFTVSSYKVSDLSDESNLYYDITFENKGSDWIRIEQVEIDFKNQDNAPHYLIVGKDLETWTESKNEQIKKSEHNKDLLANGLAWGGILVSAVGIGRGDSGLTKAGLAAAGSGVVYKTVKDVGSSKQKNQTAERVPENYILSSFAIPSDGLIRKWMLINVPQKRVADSATLVLKTVDGQKYSLKLPLAQ